MYSINFASKQSEKDFKGSNFLKLKKKSQLIGNKKLLNTVIAKKNNRTNVKNTKIIKLHSKMVKLGKIKAKK